MSKNYRVNIVPRLTPATVTPPEDFRVSSMSLTTCVNGYAREKLGVSFFNSVAAVVADRKLWWCWREKNDDVDNRGLLNAMTCSSLQRHAEINARCIIVDKGHVTAKVLRAILSCSLQMPPIIPAKITLSSIYHARLLQKFVFWHSIICIICFKILNIHIKGQEYP